MAVTTQGDARTRKPSPSGKGRSPSGCAPADLDLVRRCIDRDEEAWRRFVEMFRPIFYKTIYKTLTSMNRYHQYSNQVDDIYLECFRSIIQNLEKFAGRSALRTWLIVCIRNFTYNEVRRLERKSVPDEVDTPVEDIPLSSPEPAGEDVETEELLLKIEEGLTGRLSEKGMIFYELIFKRDLSVEEIGGTMKVSPEGVRVWKKRIRDSMKELYFELTA